ncbi:unnamed protein product [Lepeophtheirus salmonis]|uniref:(salmon louse) hypothetical protein n=1 Tax=Lepeophtheirus salmonis TaxID=72036 RepID=A0A7R8CER5_LEPSM|nr:unnamed protein product [Lepeophtheirus salmonis]CAF2793489.1 unnamed protein product [Lepeophtheirus salmonis]
MTSHDVDDRPVPIPRRDKSLGYEKKHKPPETRLNNKRWSIASSSQDDYPSRTPDPLNRERHGKIKRSMSFQSKDAPFQSNGLREKPNKNKSFLGSLKSLYSSVLLLPQHPKEHYHIEQQRERIEKANKDWFEDEGYENESPEYDDNTPKRPPRKYKSGQNLNSVPEPKKSSNKFPFFTVVVTVDQKIEYSSRDNSTSSYRSKNRSSPSRHHRNHSRESPAGSRLHSNRASPVGPRHHGNRDSSIGSRHHMNRDSPPDSRHHHMNKDYPSDSRHHMNRDSLPDSRHHHMDKDNPPDSRHHMNRDYPPDSRHHMNRDSPPDSRHHMSRDSQAATGHPGSRDSPMGSRHHSNRGSPVGYKHHSNRASPMGSRHHSNRGSPSSSLDRKYRASPHQRRSSKSSPFSTLERARKKRPTVVVPNIGTAIHHNNHSPPSSIERTKQVQDYNTASLDRRNPGKKTHVSRMAQDNYFSLDRKTHKKHHPHKDPRFPSSTLGRISKSLQNSFNRMSSSSPPRHPPPPPPSSNIETPSHGYHHMKRNSTDSSGGSARVSTNSSGIQRRQTISTYDYNRETPRFEPERQQRGYGSRYFGQDNNDSEVDVRERPPPDMRRLLLNGVNESRRNAMNKEIETKSIPIRAV